MGASENKEDQIDVSVVLPAYNEEKVIEETTLVTHRTLRDFLSPEEFEIVIAENGSTDSTPQISKRLANEMDSVKYFHRDVASRGEALEEAFKHCKGETIAYFDVDMATDMKHLEELINSVRKEGYDVVTGSRWMPGNKADRPLVRGIPSKVYNKLVRSMLGSDIRDHQCGFKAFSRDAILDLIDDMEEGHWFWDSELLLRAQRKNYRVKEFSVDWIPKGDSTVNLTSYILEMSQQLLKYFYRFKISPNITPRTTFFAGSGLIVVALFLMSYYIDFDALVAQIGQVNLLYLVVAGFIYSLSIPIRGFRYRSILRRLGFDEGLGFLTGSIFVSQTGNLVFPARSGDAIRAYIMKTRRSISYTTGFASLAVERIFDLLFITVLAVLSFVSLVFIRSQEFGSFSSVLSTSRESGRVGLMVSFLVIMVTFSMLVLIFVSSRSDKSWIKSFVNRVIPTSYSRYVAKVLGGFARDVQVVITDRYSFISLGSFSVLIWFLDVFNTVVVLLAFGISIPLYLVLLVSCLAVSLGNLAKVLPLTPGGIGLYEGAFSLIMVSLSPIGWSVALGVAIVDHAVKNIVTIIGGGISIVVLNVSLTKAAKEGKNMKKSKVSSMES